jgi:hypothetical protein
LTAPHAAFGSSELDMPTGGPRWWPVSRVQRGLLLATLVTWIIGIIYTTHTSPDYQGVNHAVDGALAGLAWSILPVIGLTWLALHYSSPASLEDDADLEPYHEHAGPFDDEPGAGEPFDHDHDQAEDKAEPGVERQAAAAAPHPGAAGDHAPAPAGGGPVAGESVPARSVPARSVPAETNIGVAETDAGVAETPADESNSDLTSEHGSAAAGFDEDEPAPEEWADEPWPRRPRPGTTLTATLAIWVLTLLPTLLACGSMGGLSVLHPDRLPYPQSVGYLLMCLAAGLLLLVAAAQVVVAGAALLGRLDNEPPTVFASLTVTGVSTVVGGALVGVLVAALAEPTGALDASHTAAPVAMAVDTLPAVDLSKARALDVTGLRNLGATAAGIFATKGNQLVDIEPLTGAVRWSVSRPGTAPDNLLWNHDNTYRAAGVEADGGRVLLTAWDYWRGVRGYAADTGRLLWSTRESSWEEYPGDFENTRQFFRNDPHSGKRLWSVAYGHLGCASPSTEGFVLAGHGATMFQCPSTTNSDPAGPGRSVVIGALDPNTGRLLWKRQANGALLSVTQGDVAVTELSLTDYQLLDARTGNALGRFNDTGYPEFLAGGFALTASKTTLRLTGPDGAQRWTVPVRPWEVFRDRLATANAVVTVIGHGNSAWVVAYDIRDGHRTVVAGPGPTPDGEQPALNLNVTTNTHVSMQSLPWGVLIPTTDSRVGVIPAVTG